MIRAVGATPWTSRAADAPVPGTDRRWGVTPNLEFLAALGKTPDMRDPALVRQAASKLLGNLFFKPLLAEMRKLPFGRKFSDGGRTEAIFGERLDVRIADAVAASDPGGLVSKLATKFQKRDAPSADTPVSDASRHSGRVGDAYDYSNEADESTAVIA